MFNLVSPSYHASSAASSEDKLAGADSNFGRLGGNATTAWPTEVEPGPSNVLHALVGRTGEKELILGAAERIPGS